MGLEWVKTCDDVFCIFGGRKLEWNGSRWGAKLNIIKVAQMAKAWNGIDLLYAGSEWSKCDAKSIQFVSFVSENGEQLHKNKVWMKGVRVVKVASIRIIMYGPYVKVELMKIRRWE